MTRRHCVFCRCRLHSDPFSAGQFRHRCCPLQLRPARSGALGCSDARTTPLGEVCRCCYPRALRHYPWRMSPRRCGALLPLRLRAGCADRQRSSAAPRHPWPSEPPPSSWTWSASLPGSLARSRLPERAQETAPAQLWVLSRIFSPSAAAWSCCRSAAARLAVLPGPRRASALAMPRCTRWPPRAATGGRFRWSRPPPWIGAVRGCAASPAQHPSLRRRRRQPDDRLPAPPRHATPAPLPARPAAPHEGSAASREASPGSRAVSGPPLPWPVPFSSSPASFRGP